MFMRFTDSDECAQQRHGIILSLKSIDLCIPVQIRGGNCMQCLFSYFCFCFASLAAKMWIISRILCVHMWYMRTDKKEIENTKDVKCINKRRLFIWLFATLFDANWDLIKGLRFSVVFPFFRSIYQKSHIKAATRQLLIPPKRFGKNHFVNTENVSASCKNGTNTNTKTRNDRRIWWSGNALFAANRFSQHKCEAIFQVLKQYLMNVLQMRWKEWIQSVNNSTPTSIVTASSGERERRKNNNIANANVRVALFYTLEKLSFAVQQCVNPFSSFICSHFSLFDGIHIPPWPLFSGHCGHWQYCDQVMKIIHDCKGTSMATQYKTSYAKRYAFNVIWLWHKTLRFIAKSVSHADQFWYTSNFNLARLHMSTT